MTLTSRKQLHNRRKVRSIAKGDASRPRLAVFRSNRFIYAQVIDDTKGVTLVSCSNLDPEVAKKLKGTKGKATASTEIGKIIAERAIAKGVKTVVFDRSGYQYHGRIKALADGAREGGLIF